MSRKIAIVSLVCLGCSVQALADMASPRAMRGSSPALSRAANPSLASTHMGSVEKAPTARPTSVLTAGLTMAQLGLGELPHGGLPLTGLPLDPATPADGAVVRDLPPLPSSATLFLSAMLTAGAWHVTRNARHLHLGPLPDWYHSGGAVQVGHVVPADPTFSHAICVLAPHQSLLESSPWHVHADVFVISNAVSKRRAFAAPRAPPSN